VKMLLFGSFLEVNNRMLAGADRDLDTRNTENDLEINKKPEERSLHTMAKVHDILMM
jgi:hypothetical protein